MSIHPSLSSKTQSKRQRSVLKRIERIKHLMEKDLWHKGDSIFHLPKVKTLRVKIKKEKVEKTTTEGVPAGGPAETAKPEAKPKSSGPKS